MAAPQNDNTMSTLLVAAALLVGSIFLIKTFGNDIMALFLSLRMIVVKAYLYLFTTEALTKAYDAIDIYTPKEWSFSDFSKMSGELRFYIAVPLMLIFIPYAYRIYKKNPLNKYTRILNRESLCASEVGLWPWIAPVLKLNIIDQPLDEGDWAMSDIVLKFCQRYALLDKNNVIIEENARKVFISQLGTVWNGVENLKPHQKAILACFLAQLNMQHEDALKGLTILSTSIAAGQIDYSFVDGYLKKYAHTEISEKFLNKNAYTYNVIATIYREAKHFGKIPPSYFIWLKVVDRKLFYTLHCVGRKLPFCEVAGIFGHGLAEETIGKKMLVPYVDKAVQGLEQGLAEVKIVES